MKSALCALCGERPAIKSHLFAGGFLRRLYTKGVKNQKFVMVTEAGALLTTKPIVEPLLCRPCDQRIAACGENWMMLNAFDGRSFRLLEKLNFALPSSIHCLSDAVAYSGRGTGIDTEKLAYFALSVLWRFAVKDWRISKNEVLSLGMKEVHRSTMRRYLKGETTFPSTFHVRATLCTDRLSQGRIIAPFEILDGAIHPCYGFLAMGVYFQIAIGNVPDAISCQSCMKEPHRVVFIRNCETISASTTRALFEKAALVPPLASSVPGR